MESRRGSAAYQRNGKACSGRLVASVAVAVVGVGMAAVSAPVVPAAVGHDDAASLAACAPVGQNAPMMRPRVETCVRHAALRLRDLNRSATANPAGRPAQAAQVLRRGMVGWQVAALQLLVAEAGFPSGPLDGRFGPRTEAATRRYQQWLGLAADGVAGRETLAALTVPPPAVSRELRWPVRAPVTSRFGLRAGRFHAGIDLGAPLGTVVAPAAPGRVTWAGWRDGGWGKLVVVAHGRGLRSLYAHLDSIDVRLGEVVAEGARIGRVGATGQATGAHLHFEVRLRGASLDPEPAFR